MSIHDSRATNLEEYREFFSILASGDRSQYDRIPKLLPFLHRPVSIPSRHNSRPAVVRVATPTYCEEDSDDDSTTSILVELKELYEETKENAKPVEVAVGAAAADATPEAPSPILPDAAPSCTIPSTPLSINQYTATQPSDPLSAFESYTSTETAFDKESRAKLTNLLRSLYDFESFQGLIREVLRDSEATYRPLKEVEALRAQAAAVAAEVEESDSEKSQVNYDPIFKDFDDGKNKHPTKKRRMARPSNCGSAGSGGDGKAGFKGVRLFMDMVSNLISFQHKGSQKPRRKKMKTSIGGSSMPWKRLNGAKKGASTDLDERCGDAASVGFTRSRHFGLGFFLRG